MFRYAAMFLVLAILFGTLGFGCILVGAEMSLAATVTSIAKILFFVFSAAAMACLMEIRDVTV